jgi:Transposase and inactivated derivatives
MSAMIRKAYKSDLSDAQWDMIRPLLPPPKSTGRQITVNLREVINAI